MEIERKFLLTALPDLTPVIQLRMHRGYLSTDPEVRVGSCEVLSGENKGRMNYCITVKGGGDLAREELETPVSEEFFQGAVRFIGKPFVRKDLNIYQLDGRYLECSVVDPGSPTSFMYGEVEFPSVEEAEAFAWPFEDAVDVTWDRSYKMKNYWLRTRFPERGTSHIT